MRPKSRLSVTMLESAHNWNMMPDRNERLSMKNPRHFGNAYLHWDKRDGEQGRLEKKPTTDQSTLMIELAIAAGIRSITIGFPTEKRIGFYESAALTRACAAAGIVPRFLASLNKADVAAVAEIQQKVGEKVEICIFKDASQIRTNIEAWDRTESDKFEVLMRTASTEGMDILLGLECASRTSEDDMTDALRDTLVDRSEEYGRWDRGNLFQNGEIEGSGRFKGVVLADTTGYLTPLGVQRLIQASRRHLPYGSLEVHLHNDRGLALANALTALEMGADGIHATWLCMGERMGNVDLAELAINMYLEGYLDELNIPRLLDSERRIAKLYGLPITSTTFRDPDAFRTYVGIHARTIVKSLEQKGRDIAEKIYAPFDPRIIGQQTKGGIGPYSSEANVLLSVAEELGVPFSAGALAELDINLIELDIYKVLLEKARAENRNLVQREVFEIVRNLKSDT